MGLFKKKSKKQQIYEDFRKNNPVGSLTPALKSVEDVQQWYKTQWGEDINPLGVLSDIPYNQEYIRQPMEVTSDEPGGKIGFSAIDSFVKNNPANSLVDILSKLDTSYIENTSQEEGKPEETNALKTLEDMMQAWNLRPSKGQKEYAKKINAPEGDIYGFYDKYWEQDKIKIKNGRKKSETKNASTSQYLRMDKEGNISTLMPFVKVTPKAHGDIDSFIAEDDIKSKFENPENVLESLLREYY